MAKPVTLNNEIDRQQKFPFGMSIRNKNTGELIDISTWQFNFTLKNNLGDVIWNIPNADISRPTIYKIYFEKSVAELEEVPSANYTPSLLATNTDMTDNEIMKGTWFFK